jgi:ketosteroid isomerase-like protein
MKTLRHPRTNFLRNLLILVIVLCAAVAFGQQQWLGEQAVWKLEHNYWEYVRANDLQRYRSLWHPDFVGWPYSSSVPVRKANITDWIAGFKDKGLQLQSYTLKPAASQRTKDVVIVHYWLTQTWTDKNGQGEPRSARITHTWIRNGDAWQIVGGMSSERKGPPTDDAEKK